MTSLDALLAEIARCRHCAPVLAHEPRPVLRVSPTARLVITSQAPGTRVHETGIPFTDRSGDRLRDWLGVDGTIFYDQSRIAIIPMGFCYPGDDGKGGDLPPRPECAPLWHPRVLPLLAGVELTLLVGSYAQRRYLGTSVRSSTTATVAAWRDYLPRYLPLPHPSWRNNGWLRRHPWFEREVLPELKARVHKVLGDAPTAIPEVSW